MESARLVTVGTINGGKTPIEADVTNLGSDMPVAVTLTADYSLADPRPPGFPFHPGFTGAEPPYPRTIAAGTTLQVLRCEAVALVTAGAASYV